MYLEDYFEEQLKLIYPERVFPGGREEQMIPPLEDEIEEEEEQMTTTTMGEDVAPAEGQKTPCPPEQGIAKVEVEETPAESENLGSERTETSQMDQSEAVANAEGGLSSVEEDKQDEATQVEDSTDGERKDEAASSSLQDESPQLPAETTPDPPDSPEKPAPGASEESG